MPQGEYSSDDVRERWNAIADAYAARCSKCGDSCKEVLLTPTVLELLGQVAGKRILDAGCGEGFLSRLLAERGASVVAVDYSDEMLRLARERTPSALDVVYAHADFAQLDMLPANSFDIVASVTAIQDVPDYESAIAEACRCLIPGGFFLLALMHPCFSSDGGWVKDADGRKLYWKVDNYFREGPREVHVLDGVEKDMVYFHRTLTSYFRAIRRAGFIVNDFVEARPSPHLLEKEPALAVDLRMCHFLVLKLLKKP